MKTEDSNQSLYMVVNKCVIEFGISFFEGLRDDTVPRKELEINAGGFAQGRRVDTKPTEISNNETN